MRIGIVNDLALAREVLRRVVTAMPGYTVAWTADDGDDAIHKAADDRPDVILMDLVMPRLNGVEATRQIMQRSPCPILVVTVSVATNYALACQAMGAGALDAVDTPTFGPGGAVQNADKLVTRLGRLEAALGGETGSGLFAAVRTAPDAADAPPPDRAVLDRLREQSLEAFQTAAASSTSVSGRKPPMSLSPFRWVAAVAAVLVVGVVLAQLAIRMNWFGQAPENRFVAANGLADDGRIGTITDAQGVVGIKPVMHERWSPVQPHLPRHTVGRISPASDPI